MDSVLVTMDILGRHVWVAQRICSGMIAIKLAWMTFPAMGMGDAGLRGNVFVLRASLGPRVIYASLASWATMSAKPVVPGTLHAARMGAVWGGIPKYRRQPQSASATEALLVPSALFAQSR